MWIIYGSLLNFMLESSVSQQFLGFWNPTEKKYNLGDPVTNS